MNGWTLNFFGGWKSYIFLPGISKWGLHFVVSWDPQFAHSSETTDIATWKLMSCKFGHLNRYGNVIWPHGCTVYTTRDFSVFAFVLRSPLDKANTPWKMNGWNLQITHLERNMIFQTSMIMFHVNLQGCIFSDNGRIVQWITMSHSCCISIIWYQVPKIWKKCMSIDCESEQELFYRKLVFSFAMILQSILLQMEAFLQPCEKS